MSRRLRLRRPSEAGAGWPCRLLVVLAASAELVSATPGLTAGFYPAGPRGTVGIRLPAISQRVDLGPGERFGRVEMKLDGQAVPVHVSNETGRVNYTPAAPLAGGDHQVELSVTVHTAAGTAYLPQISRFTFTVTPDAVNDLPPPDLESQAAWAVINRYRQRAGLPPLNYNRALGTAAMRHTAYRQAHPDFTLAAHDEIPGTPGFFGAKSDDRAAFFGYADGADEVMHFSDSAEQGVEAWLGTIYHRVPLVRASSREMGYGYSLGTHDFGALEVGSGLPTLGATLWPYPGQNDVPPLFDGEIPDPLRLYPKASKPVGYPISITFDQPVRHLTLDSAILVGPDQVEVPVYVFSPQNDDWLGDTVAMMAKAPLAPAATYQATMAGTLDDGSGPKPYRHTWSFRSAMGEEQRGGARLRSEQYDPAGFPAVVARVERAGRIVDVVGREAPGGTVLLPLTAADTLGVRHQLVGKHIRLVAGDRFGQVKPESLVTWVDGQRRTLPFPPLDVDGVLHVPELVWNELAGARVVEVCGRATGDQVTAWCRTALPGAPGLSQVPPPGSAGVPSGVAVAPDRLVLVGRNGAVFTAPDGQRWTRQTSGVRHHLFDIVYARDEAQFVATGGSGTILTSGDGIVWHKRPAGTQADLQGIAWGNGRYVAVGTAGTILVSQDALRWEPRGARRTTLLAGADLLGVAFGNGRFVAVGKGGAVLYSTDGETWLERADGPELDMPDVAYGNGTFVAITRGGPFYTSADGQSWVEGADIGVEFLDIAYHGGRFLVAGAEGALYTSRSGRAWSRVDTGTHAVITGLAGTPGKLLAVTVTDAVVTVPLPDPGPLPDLVESSAGVTPAAVSADGRRVATITVTLLDESGAPLAGQEVQLSSDAGGVQIAPASATTASDGRSAFAVSAASPVDAYFWVHLPQADDALLAAPVLVRFLPPDTVPCTPALTDVFLDHPGCRAIVRLLDLRLVSGFPDGTFRPERLLTRAEVAKVLVQALGRRPDPAAALGFNDVEGHWAARLGYLQPAVAAGAIGGFPDGSFRPDDPVTRAQLVKITAAAAGLPAGGRPSRDDVAPDAWFAGWLAAAEKTRLVGARAPTPLWSGPLFRGDTPASRAEAAILLANLVDVAAMQSAPPAALAPAHQPPAPPDTRQRHQPGPQ